MQNTNSSFLVGNTKGNNVLMFDVATGNSLGEFITAAQGKLDKPDTLLFGPDGNGDGKSDLYIATGTTKGSSSIFRFDGQIGNFIDVFIGDNPNTNLDESGGLIRPYGIAYGPDGNFYVSSFLSDQILRYNGTTGAFIDIFAQGNGLAGGLNGPNGLLFIDGSLYVTTEGSVAKTDINTGEISPDFGAGLPSQILRYNSLTAGTLPTVFATPQPSPDSFGFVSLLGLTMGEDGDLYVSDFANDIRRYNLKTGALVDTLSTNYRTNTSPSQNFIGNLAFAPNGDLLTVGFDISTNQGAVLKYNRENDSPINPFQVLVPTNSVLERPIGITFFPGDLINNTVFPSILEYTPEKTIVGTVVTNNKNSHPLLKYAISDGNLDLDNDGITAFSIDSNTGEIRINDSGDLDFDKLKTLTKNPSFNLGVTVTDAPGITDKANMVIGLTEQSEFGFDKNKSGKNGLFRLQKSTTIELSIQTVQTKQSNEILVFSVDDEDGNIWKRDEKGQVIKDEKGHPFFCTPNDANYLTQIISNTRFELGLTQIAFSILSSDNNSGLPNDFSFQNLTRNLQISGGSNIGFLLIADGTVQDLKSGLNHQVFFSNLNGLAVDNFSTQNLQLKFKDRENGNFDSLVLKIKSQPSGKIKKGTGLQNKSGLEVIDLRGQTDSAVKITVNSEAAFSNFVGFYQAVDEAGGISRNNGTICHVGDPDYIQLAINQRLNISITKSVSVLNNQTLTGNSILVPFIIANDSNISDGFDLNNIFFPFIGANSDQTKHIRLLGDNMFGFEDLVKGGDKDFDDMIIHVDFTIK